MMADATPEQLIWKAQLKQAAFISCPADDVGFGGARGGGKSDGVIGDWIAHELTHGQHAAGLAIRRERTQLVDLIERAKMVLKPLGHNWHEQDKMFRGPKGGRLRFSYLESDSDADAYQGHSYTRLYPEEIGTFPSETPINKLQATLRSGNGVPCQMKSTCNPGGPGHQWVKARYRLDIHPEGFQIFESEFTDPWSGKKVVKKRTFIPSRVKDNQYLGADYVANLFQVGSDTLVRAWLEGDWSVIEGAFFNCWSGLKHVIPPFEVPKDWMCFRSMDWGSAKPFSVGWWAIVQDDFAVGDRILPRGAMIRYREWYGMKPGHPNVGLKLTAEVVADGIKAREAKGEKITYSVLDPSAWKQDGGPSIAERMAARRVHFSKADNKRVSTKGAIGGWDILRHRLVGFDDKPMIYFFSTCVDSIRTLPALQHDADKPEDVDTEAEDHAPDDIRYAAMARPWVPRVQTVEKPAFVWRAQPDGSIRSGVTMAEIIKRLERQAKRRAA